MLRTDVLYLTASVHILYTVYICGHLHAKTQTEIPEMHAQNRHTTWFFLSVAFICVANSFIAMCTLHISYFYQHVFRTKTWINASKHTCMVNQSDRNITTYFIDTNINSQVFLYFLLLNRQLCDDWMFDSSSDLLFCVFCLWLTQLTFLSLTSDLKTNKYCTLQHLPVLNIRWTTQVTGMT